MDGGSTSGRKTRSMRAAIRRALNTRDGGCSDGCDVSAETS